MSNNAVVREEMKSSVPPVEEKAPDTLDSAVTPIEEVPKTQESTEVTSDGADIPEKFIGKSREEVIQSFVELESRLGKQGNELGELRQLADEYIKSSDTANSYHPPLGEYQEPVTQVQSNDANFYGDSDEDEISKRVKEELAPVQNDLEELRKEKFGAKLIQSHPDYEEVFSQNSFQEWVAASPMRMEMFVRADRQYDFDAADNLFSTWKAISAKTPTPQVSEELAAAAQLETSSSVADETNVKLYRRADIIELKAKNPSRYAALESEILQAYAEGRVK